MIDLISILTTGFSIISAVTLFVVYAVLLKNVKKTVFSIGSCALLLLTLSCLQWWHLDFILHGSDPLETSYYQFWLYIAPPMFYFFSKAMLFPDTRPSPIMLLHLVPMVVCSFVSVEVALPIVFLIGTGYSFWLVNIIYGLKGQRKRFKTEFFFFSLFCVIALVVLALGFSVPYIGHDYFYYFYANSIGLVYVLIVATLIVSPDLLNELSEVVQLTYASSTLNSVDVDDSLARLDVLMESSKMYQNENLSLSLVADELELSSHQLSELINVKYGINFSTYIRSRRIEEAKRLLKSEPKASVLSIGMEAGFKSQSNFYAAFKEMTGESPGSYRKSL